MAEPVDPTPATTCSPPRLVALSSFPDDSALSSALRRLGNVLGRIECVVLFGALAIVMVAALLDTFVSRGSWWYAVTRIGAVTVGLCGAVFACHEQRHFALDLVSRWLTPRGRFVVGMSVKLFTIGIVFVMTRSWLHITRSIIDDPDHRASELIVATVVLVALALIVLHTILHLVIEVDSLTRGKLPRGSRDQTADPQSGGRIAFAIAVLLLAATCYVAGPWVMLLALALVGGAPLFTIMLGATVIAAIELPRGFSVELDGMVEHILTVCLGEQIVSMVAIVLLIYAGCVLAQSGAADRLIRLVNASMGWIPGGLAIVTLAICAVFAVVSDASVVTIIALGGLVMPSVIRNAYSERLLIAQSRSLGLFILPLLIYGYSTLGLRFDPKTVELFGLAFGVAIIMIVVNKLPRQTFDIKELVVSFALALPTLVIPVGLFAGLLLGLASFEIAAFIVVYVVVLELGAARAMSGSGGSLTTLGWWTASRDAATSSGSIVMLWLASSATIAAAMNAIDARVLTTAVFSWTHGFLIAVNALVLIVATVSVIRKLGPSAHTRVSRHHR